jgi:hypothetical protein
MSWSPYPSEPRQRRSTIVRDVLAVLALVLLAWLGRGVYRLVDDLKVVTEAVGGAGSSVQNGFGAAADALSGTPVIGDDIAGALQSAGTASGGNVIELAVTGDTAIHRLALLLGLLTFLIPATILLLLYLPMRVGQIRRLRSSRLLYRDEHNPERRRLLAMRAAMSLPADHLLKYSQDPIGDLVRGDHDALVASLLADAGLAPAALTAG